METTIEERVKRILREQLASTGVRVDTLSSDYNLFEQGGFDSLDLVEAVMALEHECKVEICDTVMWSVRTVQDAINAVQTAEAEHATTR
jgi:acyl carrier protein